MPRIQFSKLSMPIKPQFYLNSLLVPVVAAVVSIHCKVLVSLPGIAVAEQRNASPAVVEAASGSNSIAFACGLNLVKKKKKRMMMANVL
jgi:hypothetical protein